MPKAIRKYPTMLSPEEQLMLVALGASLGFSRGTVVDLGPFMGGSTSAIGEGLALIQDHDTVIHSFDMFAATEQQKQKFLYARGHPAFEGRNILPLFECADPIPADAITACLHAQTSAQDVTDALDWTGTLVHDNLSHQMLDAMRAAFQANPTGAGHDDFPAQSWDGAFARMRRTIKATQV